MKIDFVITWVDGSDPAWIKEFNKYAVNSKAIDTSSARYRSWDNLQYWFRGVEEFAPWVNKIHFVTWGHVPEWLNTDHPKLNIVKHTDYIDNKNLPVFNSHPIEINLHKIKGLSEQFVYFNDDTFLTSPILSTRFFKNRLPRDCAVIDVVSIGGIEHILINNLRIINQHFSKKIQIKNNITKWFNPKNGLFNLKTILLLPWRDFSGFFDPHQAQPFLKSTFEDVWKQEVVVLEETSKSKFRKATDVNQYLFRYWQLVTGNFIPVSIKDSKYVAIKTLVHCLDTSESIIKQKYSLMCFNDKLDEDINFKEAKQIINSALEKILPQKSSYEI